MSVPPPGAGSKAPRDIRLFVMDVDGTLTDGTLCLMEGDREQKTFHAHDGAGIKMLSRVGIEPAICSGRTSVVTTRRAHELGIRLIKQGVSDKAAVVAAWCKERGWDVTQAGFMGDDLSDVPAMNQSGFSAAPANAAPEVIAAADVACHAKGGQGAVREAIEALLRSMDKWNDVLASYGAAPSPKKHVTDVNAEVSS